jgi:Golgi nucleoside diphosphatase
VSNLLSFLPQTKPGLSAYAKDPQEAAESLVSLLEEAEKIVPAELREQTPVRVGVSVGSCIASYDSRSYNSVKLATVSLPPTKKMMSVPHAGHCRSQSIRI